MDSIFYGYVYDLPTSYFLTITRAGIILKVKNYFMLGIDSESGDISDFGGTYNKKYDNDQIYTAEREFREETLNIFNRIHYKDMNKCLCCADQSNLIIFLHINTDIDLITKNFIENWHEKSEMRELIFFHEFSFFEMIVGINKTFTMYKKIKTLLLNILFKYGIIL